MTRAYRCKQCGSIEEMDNYPPEQREEYLRGEDAELCYTCLRNSDTRTERERIIDKLLLLKVIDECKKQDITLDEDKLMNLIYIIQKTCEAQGLEGFHYRDWEWREDEV